jgi:hypothetical protein
VPFRSDSFEKIAQRDSGLSAVRAAKIVTAQHNDYTGPEKCLIQGWESPIKLLNGVFILSWPFPPRASMPHFSRGPIIHDRTHL